MNIREHRKNGTLRIATSFKDRKTKTQQHMKEQCDINHIMKKYRNQDMAVAALGRGPGTYGDFSNIVDYDTALNTVIQAENAFNSLDALVRARFKNDPQQLLEFIQDDKNYEEAIKLGLIERPKGPPPPTPPSPEQPKPAKKKTTTTVIEED